MRIQRGVVVLGAMTFSKIEKIIFDLAEPIAEENGLYIYDVEFIKEGGHWFLRVYLDKPEENEYISIDECEEFSKDVLTDTQNYYLTPGIEKNKTAEHFEASKGEIVDAGLYKAINGSKTLTGELMGLDDEDNVLLKIDGETVKIPIKQTTVIRTHFEF
ncbi:MAG: ribosome maturation factor RimP [Monoglobus pectinilyticus]